MWDTRKPPGGDFQIKVTGVLVIPQGLKNCDLVPIGVLKSTKNHH